MKEPEVKLTRRELLKKVSPLGMVTLDKAACTGCGLCALECPSGALTFTAGEEADDYRLLFRHGLCVACGQCTEVCPERCLKLERTLKMAELNQPAVVLFEDEIVRCSECGSPVGPRAMIAKLQARMAASGRPFASRLELCPACKVRAQFGQLRT